MSKPTKQELRDAEANGIDRDHYTYTRNQGATHSEVIEAATRGFSVWDYGRLRTVASHIEALEVLNSRTDVLRYNRLRKFYRLAHKDALAAAQ